MYFVMQQEANLGEWKCSCESKYLNSQSLWRDCKMATDPSPPCHTLLQSWGLSELHLVNVTKADVL